MTTAVRSLLLLAVAAACISLGELEWVADTSVSSGLFEGGLTGVHPHTLNTGRSSLIGHGGEGAMWGDFVRGVVAQCMGSAWARQMGRVGGSMHHCPFCSAVACSKMTCCCTVDLFGPSSTST